MKAVRGIAIVVLLMVGSLIGCQQPAPVRPSPPSPVPPSAPSNLTTDAVSHNQVELHWFDNSHDEDGFKLYRDNKVIATLPANTTAYEDTSLEPATTYQYVVKAYNQAGESGAALCTVRTPNPPITVRLDRIGVYDNREPWTRGTDGEVYVGIIVTDGNTIVAKRFPEREGQHYKLAKNETVDIGTIIFSTDEVGDYIRIAAIGYEDDGGPGEMLLYQALGAAGEAYISGGAATLLEMTDFSLGNLLAKLFGAEDDWLGSYEDSWDSNNNWGIGRYRDIACEDERGIQCLRLWFTIESQTPTPKPIPTPPTPTPVSPVTTPDLLSPDNEATSVELRPRFVWKAVPGAKGYELIVSRHSDFSDEVISVSMGDTAYQLLPDLRYYQTSEFDTLTPLTRYYWMVVAKMNRADPNSAVACSEVWTFITVAK